MVSTGGSGDGSSVVSDGDRTTVQSLSSSATTPQPVTKDSSSYLSSSKGSSRSLLGDSNREVKVDGAMTSKNRGNLSSVVASGSSSGSSNVLAVGGGGVGSSPAGSTLDRRKRVVSITGSELLSLFSIALFSTGTKWS